MFAMGQRLKSIAVLIFGVLLSVVGKAQAAPIVIPGTSVSLEPPAGFTISSNFSGLENTQSGSSITINELPPEAYEDVSTLFGTEERATEALLRQGIAIEEHTLLDVGETQVPLLRGTQRAEVGEVIKYLTLFKGETTVLVTFNIVDPNQVTPEIVEATVASISLTAAPTVEDKVSQLSFSFQAAAPFSLSDVLSGSAALLTTVETPDPSGMSPMVIIARGQNVVDGQDMANLSERLLRGTRGFSLVEIVRQATVDFAGGSGYMIEATLDGLTVVQYAYVPANGRYIRLLATGESGVFVDVLPAVEEIVESVKVVD
ncbi:MAG: hypothetical protein AAF151_22675 [Cyanobacteria bacterium J06656_5]